MIWYLLYPLRGTTEAPVLAPSHPLRHGLSRYGSYAASHVLMTLLVSVAVATILIYPIPFLFTTDFINGASNLPHHAWTVAQPLSYGAAIRPDVMMRSIWVHGSYMQALDKNLLSSALELQDELLGSTDHFAPSRARHVPRLLPAEPGTDLTTIQRDAFHAINGLNNQSWFFHSPLQYWDCTRERILADTDLLLTVNDKKNQSTSVNVTLRHSIVFSGKRFEERRLVAADALVITLVYLRDSPVGQQWERRAAQLSKKVADRWDIYPPDGRTSTSQLYEFQFRPISSQDSFVLAVAYGLVAVYFLISLSKLRAFKSKFGLIVTVVAQIILSIMSSFTICAIFRVDLSRIPRAAYPLVVLAISLENIFRLINAVILTPSEDMTSNRIGHAFGETAHIAMASSLQNVGILLALSRWVSSGVSAFCIFIAVASGFDLFFLSTFFLSVLSVDVRRTELSDALAKASLRHNRRASDFRPWSSWDLILQGRVATSTRIAGTIVMLGFVLIAQWHFFGDDTIFHTMVRLCRAFSISEGAGSPATSLDVIHQARSPKSWLRLQDHETAQEIISIIKPSAHSYVARVYDPVVFVMKGSDRMPHYKEPTLLPAVYDFIDHHLTRFAVIVIVVIAAVRLLMNYLLWEDEPDVDKHHFDHDPTLDVKSFAGGHLLDIAMLASSPDGHVASVGLDRLIRVWDVRPGGCHYVVVDADQTLDAPFPVFAMTMDDDSTWLAILSTNKAALWDLKGRRWGPRFPVDLRGQKPEAFFFAPGAPSEDMPRLILVRRNGLLTEYVPGSGGEQDFGVCRSPLTCVQPLSEIRQGHTSPRIAVVTASRKGCVHAAVRGPFEWESRSVHLEGLENDRVHQVIPLDSLGLFLIAGAERVHIVHLDDHSLIHTFSTELMNQRSLQCAYICQHSSQSGTKGLLSLTLCYTAIDSGNCVVQTFTPPNEGDMICYHSRATPTTRGWCLWESVEEKRKHIRHPGAWSLVADGSVVGIRQRSGRTMSIEAEVQRRVEGLRHRSPRKETGKDLFERWEVWAVPRTGRSRVDEARPLFRGNENAGHLIVTELGPMIRVGQRSVAFSFGNVVKLVTVGGPERFGDDSESKRLEQWNIGSRRRKPGAFSRPRAWS